MAQPDTRIQATFIASLVLSLVIVAAGMLWSWRVGLRANKLEHELTHSRAYLAALQDAERQTAGARR